MINFTKDLLTLNPAYNDSIVQFSSSTITGATKATVTIEGEEFITVPFNGVFTFNFKEIIKPLINTNKFDDTVIPDLINSSWFRSDATLTERIIVSFRVYNLTSNEAISKQYTFYKGAEQLPNYHRLSQLQPAIRLTLPTTNFIDYNIRVFEGYPFDIGIFGIQTFNSFYFKNITTNQQTSSTGSLSNSPRRWYLSDGANNTTDTDILINSSTLNRIEFYVNNAFKCNINFTKVESKCGVYLKWVNSKGGYSYWLFDSIYKNTITTKIIDDFVGSYDNLQNLTSSSHLIGKTAANTMALNTTFDNIDAEYLMDLVYSPAVWMYAHQVPFQQVQDRFDWIGVKVNDTTFPLDNKTTKNKMAITITLPAMNTLTN